MGEEHEEHDDHDEHDEHDDHDHGPVEPPLNVLALLSVISGGLGLLSCCCCAFLPFPVAGGIMGGISLHQFKGNPKQKGKLLAQIGIGLSVAAILGFALLIVLQLTGVLPQPDYSQGFGDFKPR